MRKEMTELELKFGFELACELKEIVKAYAREHKPADVWHRPFEGEPSQVDFDGGLVNVKFSRYIMGCNEYEHQECSYGVDDIIEWYFWGSHG